MSSISIPNLRVLICALLAVGAAPLLAAEGEANDPDQDEQSNQQTSLTDPTPQTLRSTADIDAGKVVPFDLATGRVEETLPFDVQFYLRTEVSDGVTSVSGRYVGDTDALPCGEAFPRTRVDTNYGFGPRDLVASESRQVHPITFTGFETETQGGTTTRYALLNVLDGLLPNRHYCFELTRVRRLTDPDEIAKLRSDLATVIHQVYRNWNSQLAGDERSRVDEISGPVYERLRRSLIEAVRSNLDQGEQLVVPPLSFLDDALETRDVPPVFKRPFDVLAQAQGKRADYIGNLRTGPAAEAACTLGQLTVHPDLAKLGEKAGADSLSDGLAALLAGAENGLAWAELSELPPSVFQALAEGSQGAKPWTETWLPADLDTREENVTNTLASLEQLERTLSVLASSPALLQETGIGDPAALMQLLRCPEDEAELAQVPECPTSPPGARTANCGAMDSLEGVLRSFGIVEGQLQYRQELLAAVVADFITEHVETLLAEGRTMANFDVRANWYLSLDLGIAWAEDVEEFFAYVGTNIYFRPVNKKAHLRWSDFRKGQFRSELLKRLSVTVGITLDDLEREDQFKPPVTETNTLGIIGNKQLIFGAGFRVSDSLRLSVGALVFKDKNPNPLLDEAKLAWAPLVSISLDWNFTGNLKNRFGQAPKP